LHADGGDLSLPSGARMGSVAQEAPSSRVSLLDTVLEADQERTALLAEAEPATDPHRIGDIHTRLDAIDSYSAPARAASIVAGLRSSAARRTHQLSRSRTCVVARRLSQEISRHRSDRQSRARASEHAGRIQPA